MTDTLYDALAPVYDAWQEADGMTPFSLLVLPKLERALARGGAGPGSFIDFGCATGRLLLELAARRPGWRLAGLDASGAMLQVARAKPGGARIAWVAGRVDEPLGEPPFDAAGCFYDTLNHLPDGAALASGMTGIAAALRPGGLFVFDVTNQQGFQRWWRGGNEWRGPDWRLAIELRYDPDTRLAAAEVVIETGRTRKVARLSERFHTEDEVQAALAAAGFLELSRDPWSPFEIDVPGKTWWVARKR